MKRSIFISLALCALIWVGCDKVPPTPPPPLLYLEPTPHHIVFPADRPESHTFIVHSGDAIWQASQSYGSGWCTINPKMGKDGESITLSTTGNMFATQEKEPATIQIRIPGNSVSITASILMPVFETTENRILYVP